MSAHNCPGDPCPPCEHAIAETEAARLNTTDSPAGTGVSYQRADGTWRRGRDWHVPAGTRIGGGL